MRFTGPLRRRGSPYWQVRIRDPRTGRRSWRSTESTSYRVALAVLKRWELEAAEGRVDTFLSRQRVEAAIASWLDADAGRLSPYTMASNRAAARLWLARWGHWQLSELSTEEIERHLSERRKTCKASTVNQERRLLHWWFRYLERHGMVTRNPVTLAQRYPEEARRLRVLRPEERSRLFEALHAGSSEVELAARLALETGLRERTVVSLRWEWIDWDRGWLSIPAEALKSHRPLSVPLSQEAIELLRRARSAVSGRVIGVDASTVRRQWHRAVMRAGLGDLHFHDLRKTFLTDQRTRGTPMEVAMRLSDHRDLKTVLACYRAIDDSELLRAVGREPKQDAGAG